MKLPSFSLPVVVEIIFFIGVIVGIPLAIIQLQQQQNIRSDAWAFTASAVSSCPPDKSQAIITATFRNTEPVRTSTVMNVKVTDVQTGKIIYLNNIAGGQTKSGQILTGRGTLSASTVSFRMTWADNHNSEAHTYSANYSAISNCSAPSPTPTRIQSPTPKPSASPTPKPSSSPVPSKSPTPSTRPSSSPTPSKTPTPTPTKNPSVTPTACPTLGPVQNVRIECPDCP